MVKVKICGITNRDDAHAAVNAGADALGFVFAPSPRRVAPERAREIIGSLPLFVSTVGVFVDEDPASVREVVSFCNLRYIQFHGDEPPEICNAFGDRAIKAVQIKDEGDLRGLEHYHVPTFLLDSRVAGRRGGTGTSFPWELAARVGSMGRSVILSGGLNSGNVAQAIRIAAPYAVDVSSGVESEPGRKDAALMREFIRIAKTAAVSA